MQRRYSPAAKCGNGMSIRAVARNNQPHNNDLHQTGRGGAAVSSRCRPVVEARPAGEAGCYLYSGRQPIGTAMFNRHGEAVLNHLSAPMGCAPNQIFGSPRKASGFKVRGGLGRSVGPPTSAASPRAAPVYRHPFWLSSRAWRSLVAVRVVAPNRQTDNNGLEQTGRAGVPASRAIVRVAPCSSSQC